MSITIYTKSGCPNCDRAKELLKLKGLRYVGIDAENPEELANLLSRHPDARQMPQIFINGQRIGGLAGLQAAIQQISELGQ